MHRNTPALEKLATSVATARLFQIDASDRAARPWLALALGQIALSHRRIEAALCGRAWSAHNHGGHGWRKSWRDWRIRNHRDRDLGYVQQAGRYELQLARGFDRALRRMRRRDRLHERLAFGLREIDRARLRLAHAVIRIQDDINERGFIPGRADPHGRPLVGAGATADAVRPFAPLNEQAT